MSHHRNRRGLRVQDVLPAEDLPAGLRRSSYGNGPGHPTPMNGSERELLAWINTQAAAQPRGTARGVLEGAGLTYLSATKRRHSVVHRIEGSTNTQNFVADVVEPLHKDGFTWARLVEVSQITVAAPLKAAA